MTTRRARQRLLALPLLAVATSLLRAEEPDPMMYPGAKLILSSGGGGAAGVSLRGIAAKSQLAKTPDSFAKVVAFYDDKFDAVDFAGTRAKADPGHGDCLSVMTTPRRPFDLKTYVRYEPDSSTTVVVSRAPGEEVTYLQIVTNSHTYRR